VVIGGRSSYVRPAFCGQCGKPFPWTVGAFEAAALLAKETEELDASDCDTLSESLGDIVVETPKTPVATARIKRIIGKAGPAFGNGLRDLLVDVVSETVKKSIWP
jgi:hypothetical protein